MEKLLAVLLLSLFFLGCATSPEIEEAKDLQLNLVENLNTNYQVICAETLNLYERQAISDQEFIFGLVKDEDPDRADKLLREKLATIKENLSRLRAYLEANKRNYEQFKRLWEALR